MPKFLLLKHYRGGPELPTPVPPMPQWDPKDIEAHMAFLGEVNTMLEESGELVDAQALTFDRVWVRYGGPDADPVLSDGPHPETADLVAGWYMVDVALEGARDRDRRPRLERARSGREAALRVDRRPPGDGGRRHAARGLVTDGVTPSTTGVDEGLLRALVPQVLATLVRRGEEFAAAEDALQEALVEALRVWPENPPTNPRGWLLAVARRRLVDARRSETARRRREAAVHEEPAPGPTEQSDDTLLLLFLCAHPGLTPASAVALTLRAVGGLTTREIADAFMVPEATMAQRISRAKKTVQDKRFDEAADIAVVLRVLYLIYTAGHSGRVDLAAEAIRLARQLAVESREPEVRGLLALMLLHHARLPARTDATGRLVPLDEQDRTLWDRAQIAEGVVVLQGALAEDRRGPYQLQAAIAALHDDAATAAETDWAQVLEWYDELLALREDPAAALSRAVAVGHVHGPAAGLVEVDRLVPVLGERHRVLAVQAYLHELDGALPEAATLYAAAAEVSTSATERDHLVRRAALARSGGSGRGGRSRRGGDRR